ncbi:DNA-directed RNA polymerase III subunit RPC9 [Parasteatoda tepidariorum]|uniref:DNA-directed RNA polymerase III subunit RPC9 n=1 Tax=Parasteatoda tepidariorum TaxID=114398 RepID=UPI00077FAB3D|nr:DNA-directed RNA polymerase III subunit RPC9 [Parasteatoda tepidariorum]
MEVINERAALLSNAEVFSLLETLKSDLKESKYSQRLNKNEKEKGKERLNTIVYETFKYLEEMPCASQSEESIKNFLIAIAPYELTKAEKLQLLNLQPKSLVEIQLLIEECEERFTEDQMNDILNVVAETLSSSTENEEGSYEEN